MHMSRCPASVLLSLSLSRSDPYSPCGFVSTVLHYTPTPNPIVRGIVHKRPGPLQVASGSDAGRRRMDQSSNFWMGQVGLRYS